MKVSLVVATGVHQGKAIPVLGPQFVIGRDEGCQLRPASPAISKRHCAVRVRDGKVFVEDFGSTNGTFLNDEPVVGEVEVAADDRLRVGPLDFRVDVKRAGASDSTPLPEALKATAPAPKLTPAAQRPAAKPTPAAQPPVAKPTPAAQAPATRQQTQAAAAAKARGGDDDIAAMLLGMDGDEPAPEDVPGGSTIMEMAPVDAAKLADAKAAEQKKVVQQASSKDAASELLRKYMRRPK